MPKRRLLLFFSLILLSFVLMTYQANTGIFKPFLWLKYPLNWTNKTINSVSSSFKGTLEKIRLRDEDNKKLREELNTLLLERQQYRETVLENERLRQLLSLKEKEKKYVTAARVIARGNDRWANTLVIDKGSRDGVEKDMVVITPKGLAGKILSASDSYSQILLVTDINFSAAIRLQESRTEGIISGTGSKICILKYISHEYEIKDNEMILTSGLDSLFPADIPVGYVSKVEQKTSGIFQYVEVVPFQDNINLEEVIVVKR